MVTYTILHVSLSGVVAYIMQLHTTYSVLVWNFCTHIYIGIYMCYFLTWTVAKWVPSPAALRPCSSLNQLASWRTAGLSHTHQNSGMCSHGTLFAVTEPATYFKISYTSYQIIYYRSHSRFCRQYSNFPICQLIGIYATKHKYGQLPLCKPALQDMQKL